MRQPERRDLPKARTIGVLYEQSGLPSSVGIWWGLRSRFEADENETAAVGRDVSSEIFRTVGVSRYLGTQYVQRFRRRSVAAIYGQRYFRRIVHRTSGLIHS